MPISRGVLLLAAILSLCGAARADARVDAWRGADDVTRQFALRLARRAFDTYVKERRTIAAPDEKHLPPLLRARGGVFVSTMVHGAPRTCMGTLFPTESNLAREIVANAAAAGHDLRFAPVKKEELSQQILIVSIVGRPRLIGEQELIHLDPVRDGLAARGDGGYGVVLPGETRDRAKMIKWARIRAGIAENETTEYYQLDAVRFMEQKSGRGGREENP